MQDLHDTLLLLPHAVLALEPEPERVRARHLPDVGAGVILNARSLKLDAHHLEVTKQVGLAHDDLAKHVAAPREEPNAAPIKKVVGICVTDTKRTLKGCIHIDVNFGWQVGLLDHECGLAIFRVCPEKVLHPRPDWACGHIRGVGRDLRLNDAVHSDSFAPGNVHPARRHQDRAGTLHADAWRERADLLKRVADVLELEVHGVEERLNHVAQVVVVELFAVRFQQFKLTREPAPRPRGRRGAVQVDLLVFEDGEEDCP
mmetsp:Transcript_18739/g.59811  ORF Transcript_18739/g.59811 Transcript_18739/m.59811 type:complete len:258 (+) Transcript_18739:1216-1989(+)